MNIGLAIIEGIVEEFTPEFPDFLFTVHPGRVISSKISITYLDRRRFLIMAETNGIVITITPPYTIDYNDPEMINKIRNTLHAALLRLKVPET